MAWTTAVLFVSCLYLILVSSEQPVMDKRLFLDQYQYCSSPMGLVHNHVTCQRSGTRYHTDDWCEVKCDYGHQFPDGSTLKAIKCTGALWTPFPDCIDDKTTPTTPHLFSTNACPTPPSVENGTFVCSTSTHITGTSCSLYCSKRHQLYGNENIYCTSSRTWTSPGSCIESRCPNPPTIQQGSYGCPTNTYPHGATCSLTCTGGFRPVSSTTNITCRDDDTWSPTTSCMEGCLPGTYIKKSPSGDQVCEACAKGTYQPAVDSSSCVSCPDGWSTKDIQAVDVSSCLSMCHVGTYSATGVEPCHLCMPGTYQNVTGGTTCHDCPLGMTSSVGSATCSSV